MRLLPIVLLLSFFVVSVRAEPLPSPTITSIAPTRGTVGGGDIVTINVSQSLFSCPICSPPAYEAEVTFDGIPARSVSARQFTIYAIAPAREAGTVDVAVTSGGLSYGTARFTYVGMGQTLERSNYEKVLIPLAISDGQTVPGAFGSRWSSELWVSNHSQYPVELFRIFSCSLICGQPAFSPEPYPSLGPGQITKLNPSNAITTSGALYYLQRGGDKDVTFSLHVADVSHSEENAGTEIGVVRERDFRPDTFEILNVPLNSGSRATLRLYDTDGVRQDSSALVEIENMDGTTVASTSVPVHLSVATDPSNVAPPLAGYGEIADLRSAHFDMPVAAWPAHVRVRVTMNGVTGWGFVSVTNNDSQLITTYRPE